MVARRTGSRHHAKCPPLKDSRLARECHQQSLRCCIRFPARTCRRHHPGGDNRSPSFAPQWAVPVPGSLSRIIGGAASGLSLSRPARRSLALRPTRSLSRPTAALLHRSAPVHCVSSKNRSECYRPERTTRRAGLPRWGAVPWHGHRTMSAAALAKSPRFGLALTIVI